MKHFHYLMTNWTFLQLFQPPILYPFLGDIPLPFWNSKTNIVTLISELSIGVRVFRSAALYIIESEMVLAPRRFRCQIAILPEILNSRSTAHPDAGTGKTSLAILDKSGYSRPF